MSASDTMTQAKDRAANEACWLAPGDGDARWVAHELARMAGAAARYGVTILGPPPGEATEGGRSDG